MNAAILFVIFLAPMQLSDGSWINIATSTFTQEVADHAACTNAGRAHKYAADQNKYVISWVCVPKAIGKLEVVPPAKKDEPKKQNADEIVIPGPKTNS